MVHAVSPSCGASTPEVYEIWSGRAVILMQERDGDDPGRCFAVEAEPGQVVVVPRAGAHATISADPERPLTFGAWCVRDFGFDYRGVRAHGGLAWFPLLDEAGGPALAAQRRLCPVPLVCKAPQGYPQLGIEPGVPIYTQFAEDPDRFLFVSHPQQKEEAWKNFLP